MSTIRDVWQIVAGPGGTMARDEYTNTNTSLRNQLQEVADQLGQQIDKDTANEDPAAEMNCIELSPTAEGLLQSFKQLKETYFQKHFERLRKGQWQHR